MYTLLADTGSMAGVSESLMAQFTSIGTELTGLVTDILPIALGILGAVLVITKGISLFKKITGKA